MEIFISFSGRLSECIATEIKKWMQKIFSCKILLFQSNDITKGANWVRELGEKLKKCNYAISILTADNVNNPWINFEAGAICTSKDNNLVHTILFGIDEVNHSSPLSIFQYSKFDEIDLLKLLNVINNTLGSDRLDEFSLMGKFKESWPSFQKNILSLINSYKNQTGGKVETDGYFDLSPSTVFCGNVIYQDGIPASTSNIFPNKNIEIKEMPSQLKRFLHDHVNFYYKKTHTEEYEKTRVLINKTRISTFFSFTDRNRILLYDRVLGEDKTTVENPRRDVFGSVDFENYSIFKKINNEDFFNCITEDIELIPGFVFEDNTTSSSKTDRETVIMFGYNVFLNPGDLEKGKLGNPAVDLFNIRSGLSGSFLLTAKARHAIESLIDLKNTPNP